MKIAVIASSEDILNSIKGILEINLTQDQFVFLDRHDGDIDIERVDLFSTNILILDAATVSASDMRSMSNFTKEHVNPAIIYSTNNTDKDGLLKLMRSGVMEVISYPINQVELIEAIERLRARRYIASTYRPRGKILSFLSAKGGAGATFISTNFGYSLAENCNQKVLFIDLHMQFGDAAFYLAESAGSRTLADVINQTGLDSALISSACIKITDNYFLLQAPDSPDKAVGIKSQHIDNLLTVAIQDYDFIIVDLPKEIESISMKVLDRSEKIFIIFQPVFSYLRAVVKVLHLFNLLGYESKKIIAVLNRMDKAVGISLSKMEEVIQKPIEWIFPNDFLNSTESVNTGIPIEKLHPNASLSKMFKQRAQFIAEITSDQSSQSPWYKKWFA